MSSLTLKFSGDQIPPALADWHKRSENDAELTAQLFII